jgi:2-C-methyl-D-erythritol 4-phosphate cytidylyltransferase
MGGDVEAVSQLAHALPAIFDPRQTVAVEVHGAPRQRLPLKSFRVKDSDGEKEGDRNEKPSRRIAVGLEVEKDGGSFEQDQKKAKIAQPDMNCFEVSDPKLACALSLKVFLGWKRGSRHRAIITRCVEGRCALQGGSRAIILYTSQVMRVFVILPAAGIGTRMAAGSHAAAPKQFLSVGGVPVLVRSVKAFLEVSRVDAVCVAVRASERERVRAQMDEYELGARVHVVEGGDSRQESVGNALAALESQEDDIVLVHDAVRPLIDAATIERTIDAVERHGAAIVGLPAVDTIKQVERMADGAIITSTIPRERIVLAQTPQGARVGLLRRAFAEAETDGFAGTDEASLLERAGIEVAVVPGSAKNFKITQPGDIELAEFYLQQAGAR